MSGEDLPGLRHAVFNRCHSETELRGTCAGWSRALSPMPATPSPQDPAMKLNATAEMFPVSWPSFHPAASVRARRPVPRLSADVRGTGGMARALHKGLCPPTQCRLSPGRVRGPAGHPRLA